MRILLASHVGVLHTGRVGGACLSQPKPRVECLRSAVAERWDLGLLESVFLEADWPKHSSRFRWLPTYDLVWSWHDASQSDFASVLQWSWLSLVGFPDFVLNIQLFGVCSK